jgi:stage V sporulation protein B
LSKESLTKDSLIKGTIILALAAFVARFLGVVQKVPLKHLLDDAGMGTFAIANTLYLSMLTVATLGIPSVLAKLISEKAELGQEAEAGRIFQAAVFFAIGSGIVITALLYLGAPLYAGIAGDPDSELAIKAIAPTLLLFPLVAMMRGYFQGMRMMMPGGLSQIVEQILRVVSAITLAYVLLQLGYGRGPAAAGAAFGSVMGGVGAILVMLYYWVKWKRTQAGLTGPAASSSPQASPPEGRMRLRSIYALIFRMSVPISLIAMTIPLINNIDSMSIIPLLKNLPGFDSEKAQEVLGIVNGRGLSLAGIPPILAIALSQSVLPVVSSAFARNDLSEVSRQSSVALRLAVLSGLPVILALFVAARPINGLLFADTKGTAMISVLIAITIFQILMMTSASILMGLGHIKPQIAYVVIGLAVKLLGSFLLAPFFGIYGIITATALCFMVINQLNLRALRKIVDYELLGRRWSGVIITTLSLTAVGLLLNYAADRWMQPFASQTANFGLQALVICAIVGALYPLLLFATRAVTAEDVQSFPPRIQKLLRRGGRFVRVRSRG